jgi:hypothetical protein
VKRADTGGAHGGSGASALFNKVFYFRGGTRWRIWLRNRATIREVAGSISDGVTIIIDNPSGLTVALGSTQLLTEMS